MRKETPPSRKMISGQFEYHFFDVTAHFFSLAGTTVSRDILQPVSAIRESVAIKQVGSLNFFSLEY